MSQPKKRAAHTKRRWTAAEDALLRQRYPDVDTPTLSLQMGRSHSSITQHAVQMGLRRSAQYLAQNRAMRLQRLEQHPAILAARFRPGLTPWNKGAQYRPGGRSAQTQFKPGRMPPTTLPIGTLRIVRGVLMVKYADTLKGPKSSRWISLQRYVWESAHGPTPAGHIVVFKPGQHSTRPEDVVLERLELISYAANVQRNSYWASLPHDVAQLVQLKGCINRQINRMVREQAGQPATQTQSPS